MRSTSCCSFAASARIAVMAAQWYRWHASCQGQGMNALLAPEAAEVAGLRYVSGAGPGIRRVRAGNAFRYLAPGGRPIRKRATLARIGALVIPPAWTEVWICPHEDGHLQAWGRDARRRKQYRYHDRWREVRDATKYARLASFGRALPRIRRQAARDLARPGLPREKVLATVVRLLESTFVRVGNAEYTSKDFRTWAGTLLCARALRAMAPPASAKGGQSELRRAIEHAARELRNTPAVCRKCYIHPAVIESYLSGRLQQAMRGRTEAAGLIRVLESRGNGHRVQARTLRPRHTGTRHAHTGGTLYTARSGVRRYQRELSTGPSG